MYTLQPVLYTEIHYLFFFSTYPQTHIDSPIPYTHTTHTFSHTCTHAHAHARAHAHTNSYCQSHILPYRKAHIHPYSHIAIHTYTHAACCLLWAFRPRLRAPVDLSATVLFHRAMADECNWCARARCCRAPRSSAGSDGSACRASSASRESCSLSWLLIRSLRKPMRHRERGGGEGERERERRNIFPVVQLFQLLLPLVRIPRAISHTTL